MALTPGTQLGSHEITSLLGKGGMGEVYRARDSKLKREVAIKILPDEFNRDPARVARFQREAEALASLNHQNIAAIYDLQEAQGSRFLVLELVEGETLAEILVKRGALPVDEALSIARQICEALEAAHDRGIIHRDLKPANIKVTPDGKVKVLDFGLAKAFDSDAPSADRSNSPTLSFAATNAGVILGTAAYMSPEQAKGKPVDRRSDIFAFGSVLYEMLTGRSAFDGEDVADILGSVLKSDPDWKPLPAAVPPSVRKLLKLCLEKNPKNRRSSAADVRIDIEQALMTPNEASAHPEERSAQPDRRPWIAAAVLLIATVVLAVPAVTHLREAAPSTPLETRTEIITPLTTDPVSFAISPDGRQLAFVASGDGQPRLWLRPLSSTIAKPLSGTEGAAYPFWSPDSRSVGFFAGGKIKRLDIGAGLPQIIVAALQSRGGTWNADGTILFPKTTSSGLSRVSASGGEPVDATKLAQGQSSHRFPRFLPNGKQFLFYVFGGKPEITGIYLGSLDSFETKRLTAADASGICTSSGWLLWIRGGALVAQKLDSERGVLVGERVTIADPAGFETTTGASAVSVSSSDIVVYRSGAAGRRQLLWFDRAGKVLGSFAEPDESGLSSPSLSPDGRRVAAQRNLQGNYDVWVVDGARTARFTTEPSIERYPVWSADGSQIVFDSNRSGPRNLYVKTSSGAGVEQLLLESNMDKGVSDWSRDGRFIFFHALDPKSDFDLWVLPTEGERKPWLLLKTDFSERWTRLSPDGQWFAYVSNESGPNEVYIRQFVESVRDPNAKPAAEIGQSQVSTTGGGFPVWRADGKELFYIGTDARMMAAPIIMGGKKLEPGAPVALFQTHIYGGGVDVAQGRQFDVSKDGRFLINTVLDDATSPITVIQNWKPKQ